MSLAVNKSKKITKSEDERPYGEEVRIRDAALKRMLGTPPQPYAEDKGGKRRSEDRPCPD